MKYVYCAGVLALSSVQVLHVEYNYNCKSDEFNLRFNFLNPEDKGSLFSYVKRNSSIWISNDFWKR